ncbi:RECQ4 helicase, partial [Dicaeum eximium]|nr:RECQ4 helicase [Dicaeum eximium]
FACLDEVHCISQWSHNFRPAYLRICKVFFLEFQVLRERLGVRCFLGLTATATAATARDVAEHLGVRPENGIGIGTFGIPENLRLSVSVEFDPDQALLRLLREWNSENFGNCGDFGNSVIVYCTRREESERLAELIQREFPEKFPNPRKKQRKVPEFRVAAAYHAGLSPRQRREILRGFMADTIRVLCATTALGLGLHKAALRGVLHRNGPGSLEGFVQEIGRAGRDGRPACCHLFLEQEVTGMGGFGGKNQR